MIGIIATVLVFLLPALAISYQQSKTITTAIAGGSYLVLIAIGWLPIWVAVIYAIIALPIMAFVFMDQFRRSKFTAPFMGWFKQQLPKLTQDEREALNAGGLWWEAKLFNAKPDWQNLQNLDALKLTAEEQSFLDNETEQLCQMLDDWQIVNELADMPQPVWQFIRDKGFLSFIISKDYGGKGFSAYAHSCIVSKIATRSMSAAVNIMVPNSLGPAEFLMHFGTDEQKNKYLPRLAAGKEIPCFGLTAPEAGSDAASITDIGVVCKGEYQGQEVIGVRLNFNKRYITLAPVATLMGIAFKLYDPDHLLGKKESIGITFALLPTDHPGVEIGKRHWPSQLAFMNGPIRGNNVFVPMEFMLGGEDYYGKGWQMMMECLAVGRGISLPALATAGAKFSARMTANYCQLRHQFKRPIGDFEGIGLLLGKMTGFSLMAEATRRFTLRAIDDGNRPSIATAITKYHLTELSRQSIISAMDIHGGKAVQTGPSNYLHLLYNAAPTAITVEGANILTRNLMIFGQGAMRCHPFIADEIVASGEDDLHRFDHLLMQHAGYFARVFSTTLGYGLTGGRAVRLTTDSPFKKQLKQLQSMSYALAFVSEFAFVVLGKQLKVNEAISARLGDVLSYLYMGSALIAYQSELGSKRLNDVTEWCLDYCLQQIQIAFNGVFHNFPKKWLAKLLKRIVFPWGDRFQGPSDQLTLKISQQIQTDKELRDDLYQFCFHPTAEKDAIYTLEKAWDCWHRVQPLLKIIDEAVKAGHLSRKTTMAKSILEAADKGVISADDKKQLDQALDLIWQVIQVDEFDTVSVREPVSH